MKKNVRFSVGEVWFEVEETAHELLQGYLEGVRSHFAHHPKSQSMMREVEQQIASLLLARIRAGWRSLEKSDVEWAIEQMGQPGREKSATSHSFFVEEVEHRLFRDQANSILGGVCSGIGYFFSIDPVWIRLLFVVLAVSSFGIMLLVYIVFWVALPELKQRWSADIRRVFRDPDNAVLGGVASGLAYFFGIGRGFMRFLFIASILIGGMGLLVYLTMWMTLPEANSVIEKRKMRGEPITINDIEQEFREQGR